MAQATYRQGDARMMDYTPGSAVSAGDVVVLNNMRAVAHKDIAASTLGAAAIEGGIYACTADAAIAVGKKVYWDDTANKVTETSSGNKGFGWTVSASAADGDAIYVFHQPF